MSLREEFDVWDDAELWSTVLGLQVFLFTSWFFINLHLPLTYAMGLALSPEPGRYD